MNIDFFYHIKVCVRRKFSFDWDDMCNLAFIATTILNFGIARQPGQASPKFKIVAAMNANLHISPQSKENFLLMQTLINVAEIICSKEEFLNFMIYT